MNPNVRQILESEVVSIQNYQWTTSQLTADFYLKENQAFRGTISQSGYLFIPISAHDQIPDIKKIYWRKKDRRGYGDRTSALLTEVTFSNTCSPTDQQAYRQILTPYPIDEGHWVPFPDFHTIPLLDKACQLKYHWGNVVRMSQAKIQAEQNLQDFMAMRRQTYDLRQYGC